MGNVTADSLINARCFANGVLIFFAWLVIAKYRRSDIDGNSI
jgi:hypothetical protein